MKVSIKRLDASMNIKNKGIELDVYDGRGRHLGDLIVTKAHLIWCKGRTRRRHGKKLTWKKFMAVMSEQ